MNDVINLSSTRDICHKSTVPFLIFHEPVAALLRVGDYTVRMDHIIDQLIISVLCLLLLPLAGLSSAHVVAFLCVVIVVCLFNLHIRSSLRYLFGAAYLLAAIVFPSFALFVPLVAYVMFSERTWLARLAWVVSVVMLLRVSDLLLVGAVAVLCIAACFMSWRTAHVEEERTRYRKLRDEQQETALSLAEKNRDLMAAQDYEVRLATLSERSRIAREIHDNVGHLLTRSVLQVEALQVVHADDEHLREELTAVGETLHEAMDTVRKSVHDLHDDALDLHAQLESVIGACGVSGVRLIYDAEQVSVPVAYGIVAVVREALSNVAKHSDATRVDVSVIEYPALYQLVVQDNGTRIIGKGSAKVGITQESDIGSAKMSTIQESDTGSSGTARTAHTARATISAEHGAPSSRGIGLQTMEERMVALGGRLTTEYRKGFRVFATIPKEQA